MEQKNTGDIQVEMMDIKRIIPYARNPRKISETAIGKVAASIKEFGFRQPIVVDGEMVVIVGHTRLAAAQKLGMESVPVHVAKNLTEAQIKAYRIADNRTGEESEWNEDFLKIEIDELKLGDFDISLTGFDLDELDFGEVESPVEEQDAEPVQNPVSSIGDIWTLGDHRLMCGDSTNKQNVADLLGDASPNLMVTDPPYGFEYDALWREESGLGVGKGSKGKVLNDDRADWQEAWDLFPGNICYVWHGALHADVVAASLKQSGFSLRAQIIWAKQLFALSRGDYHWQHEPCWYAVRKKGNWKSDRKQTTVWEIKNNNSFGNAEKEETVGHSTQKPIECMLRPILHCSSPGDYIYEPFSGSGSTIIACESSKRKCLAMELSPQYVDSAILRWQKLTKMDAVNQRGEKYNDLRAK